MVDIPAYSNIVVVWEAIKEDIPAFLSNPYLWLEGQMQIYSLGGSNPDSEEFKILLEIMNMLNNIHSHIHDE